MKKVIGKQSLNELRQTKEHQTTKSDQQSIADKEKQERLEKIHQHLWGESYEGSNEAWFNTQDLRDYTTAEPKYKEPAEGFEKEILLARFFTIKNDIERTISTLQKEIILQRTTLERLDSLLDSLTQ
tara:strand:+ start:25 stop:405 length:381 start_codon:yes stop_codon:yes gene_type:complete